MRRGAGTPWSPQQTAAVQTQLQRILEKVVVLRHTTKHHAGPITLAVTLVGVERARHQERGAQNWSMALQIAQSIAKGFTVRD